MVIDRIQPSLAGQSRDRVELTSDHSIRSCDQILVGLPVDEAKQDDDENRQHTGNRQRPVKGSRTYDWHLTHHISPREFPAERQRRVTTGHLSLTVRCEE